jgi:hypothetical protein
MLRLAAVLGAAALVVSAAGAAPIPVQTRAEAVANLKSAIEDEKRAIELLKKDPPHLRAARARIRTAADHVSGIYDFLSTVPNAAAGQDALGGARADDYAAEHLLPTHYGPRPKGLPRAIEFLERALLRKRAGLPFVQDAQPPPAVSQCSDGKDNDRDGITDWTTEPGCTSAKDVRESSRFTCGIGSAMATGRLVLSGSCSGVFSEVEVKLLDGVVLNGRWDITHAPSCGPTTPTGFRCKTKAGDQNPKHLLDIRLATTSAFPDQRVQLRFFDVRKRQIGRFVVPPLVVPQSS